jgi:CubicO group peptidase (beta-lactamase class C family)
MAKIEVHGSVARGFDSVAGEFEAVLRDEGIDVCAQVAVCHRGQMVVDLWAGADASRDSLLGIYSAGKGVTHLVVALLVQEGSLDLDQRVSHYWPEFGVNGKHDLLVRELLSHRAGLVGCDTGFTMAELADDRVVAERLAARRPFWHPAAASGYHALVMAALSGELVRRVTGAPVQDVIAQRLCGPYELDLHFGLPPSEDGRFLPAQPVVTTPERARAAAATATAPNSLSGIAFNRHHPDNREVWELPNLDVVRTNGPASFGAVGTARALARLYCAAAVGIDGDRPLLTPDTVSRFAQIQYAGWDLVLRQHKAWAVGFHAVGEIYPMVGQGAFGHSGAGGQQAFVDPRNELSYAFLRRRFAPPTQTDGDHGRLLRAIYAAAGAPRSV